MRNLLKLLVLRSGAKLVNGMANENNTNKKTILFIFTISASARRMPYNAWILRFRLDRKANGIFRFN